MKSLTAAKTFLGVAGFRFPLAEIVFRPVFELEFQLIYPALSAQSGFDEFNFDGYFIEGSVEPDECQFACKGDNTVQNGEFELAEIYAPAR